MHGIQMFSIRREQGRLAEIAPLVRLIASGQTEADSVWRPALAVLLAEIGDVERGASRAHCARRRRISRPSSGVDSASAD